MFHNHHRRKRFFEADKDHEKLNPLLLIFQLIVNHAAASVGALVGGLNEILDWL